MPEKQKTNQRDQGGRLLYVNSVKGEEKKKKMTNRAIKLKFPLQLPWVFQRETLRES